MTVFLLLYLCTDATRISCQVVPAQQWTAHDAYERCITTASEQTAALTAKNRTRHRFVCDPHIDVQLNDEQQTQPKLTRQSFRL